MEGGKEVAADRAAVDAFGDGLSDPAMTTEDQTTEADAGVVGDDHGLVTAPFGHTAPSGHRLLDRAGGVLVGDDAENWPKPSSTVRQPSTTGPSTI